MKTTLAEHQVFAAVVDSGSITAAAEQLGQAVSGVSRSLARLKHKLETTLLARTTRRTKLTDEGLALLPLARCSTPPKTPSGPWRHGASSLQGRYGSTPRRRSCMR